MIKLKYNKLQIRHRFTYFAPERGHRSIHSVLNDKRPNWRQFQHQRWRFVIATVSAVAL